MSSAQIPAFPIDSWSHGYTEANGIRFHYVEAGSGPLLVLLHGFPEFWYSWRNQIPKLAEHFRVVAPDLRGYNETEKPRDGYDIRTLVEDVQHLARAFDADRYVLCGHDWGGVIAWHTASRHPESVEKLVILNGPHPTAMTKALRTSLAQMRRSWYIFLFQIPGLGERRLKRNNFAAIENIFRNGLVHKERMTDADLELFKQAMAKPGALYAALEYYREAFRAARRDRFALHDVRIDVPTQVIWGEQDTALGTDLVKDLGHWVSDLRLDLVPTAGHWVQQDEPDVVAELMLDFLVKNEKNGVQE